MTCLKHLQISFENLNRQRSNVDVDAVLAKT
jgi:hypothetical protein